AVASMVALLVTSGSAWALPPGVRVVNPAAPAGGTGLSWGSAYNSLQSALAAPGVTEIWVAAGTCPVTTTAGLYTATFSIPGGVAVDGGFGGFETARDQRDWVQHTSVLTGALPGGGGVYHVVTMTSAVGATVDGFTITGGAARGFPPHHVGAGLTLA